MQPSHPITKPSNHTSPLPPHLEYLRGSLVEAIWVAAAVSTIIMAVAWF